MKNARRCCAVLLILALGTTACAPPETPATRDSGSGSVADSGQEAGVLDGAAADLATADSAATDATAADRAATTTDAAAADARADAAANDAGAIADAAGADLGLPDAAPGDIPRPDAPGNDAPDAAPADAPPQHDVGPSDAAPHDAALPDAPGEDAGAVVDSAIADPCAQDLLCALQQRECLDQGGWAVCGDCLPGYHEEGALCAANIACPPDPCSLHGLCDDSSGLPWCRCEDGYVGAQCELCDALHDYHRSADGTTCTRDLCDPDPCATWDREVCSDGTCSCDDACATVDERVCADGERRTCVLNGSGCLEYSSPYSCPSGVCADAQDCAIVPVVRSGSFVASPDQVYYEVPTAIRWTWSMQSAGFPAASCSIDHGIDAVVSGDVTSVTQTATETYTLSCSNLAGTSTAQEVVTARCNNGCASAGATQCSAGELRTCVADDYGCLSWSEASPCPDGSCRSATECGPCIHACDTPGDTCNLDGVTREHCWTDSYGCRQLTTTVCPRGCADGGCNYQPDCDVETCSLVPPTKQTTCASNSAGMSCTSFPCNADGSPSFCGQDTQYPETTRTFTCHNADGSVQDPCAATASANEVVTDSLTQLMWQRTVPDVLRTWSNAGTYCSDLSYGGHSDWRLPSYPELASLLAFDRSDPAMDASAFPKHTTLSSIFWTSSGLNTTSDQAWYISFLQGTSSTAYRWSCWVSGSGTPRCGFYLARCVRGGYAPGSSASSGRFLVSEPVVGQQIVADRLTGLQWAQHTTGNGTWQRALSQCEGLSFAGHDDWRLPDVHELFSLVVVRDAPASTFPQMPSAQFWSSTSRVSDPSNAFIVYMGTGYVTWTTKTYDFYNARCVRGGP